MMAHLILCYGLSNLKTLALRFLSRLQCSCKTEDPSSIFPTCRRLPLDSMLPGSPILFNLQNCHRVDSHGHPLWTIPSGLLTLSLSWQYMDYPRTSTWASVPVVSIIVLLFDRMSCTSVDLRMTAFTIALSRSPNTANTSRRNSNAITSEIWKIHKHVMYWLPFLSKHLDSHLKPYRCKIPACEAVPFSSTAACFAMKEKNTECTAMEIGLICVAIPTVKEPCRTMASHVAGTWWITWREYTITR